MFDNQNLIEQMPYMQKFAMRLTHNASDAEDLVQNTLLRAMEKNELFKEGTNLKSWTSKIMFNLFVSSYRRKTKFETKYDPETYLERISIGPSQDHAADLSIVGDIMKKMSSEHYEVLTLICVKGMRYQEVSSFLNIPIGTVRSRLSRARECLQAALDKNMPVAAAS